MSVLRTAPWVRAPGLLLRRPVLLAAIAGTFALLAVAAASGPLFLSSVGAAALQRQESRGMHQREDLPASDAQQARRQQVGGLEQVWVRPDTQVPTSPLLPRREPAFHP